MVAAHLEIAELVERGTGRREQHHGLRDVGFGGVAGGKFERVLDRAGNNMRHLAFERGSEISRRFPDKISVADAREEARERGDAAGLLLAAGDPENVAETGERLRGGI